MTAFSTQGRQGLLCACLCALLIGTAMPVKAEKMFEGFESVTLTDAEGNPLANSWSYGYGLSNGWKVVGGSIYGSAGSTNYGLWSTAYEGSKSLEASYSASNKASVVITQPLTGTLTFWARKTSSSSSTKGTINLYEAEDNGDGTYTVTSTLIYSNSNLTTTWFPFQVDLGSEGKLVAINMVRAAIDNIEADVYVPVTDAPVLAVFADAEATSRVKAVDSHYFGLAERDTTVTYYIKNAGAGTLQVTGITATGVYQVDKTEAAVEAGEQVAVSVTLPYAPENYGYRSGKLTIQAEGQTDVTISLTGLVRDPQRLYTDFSTLPEGWTLDSGWSLHEDGYLTKGYSTANVRLPLVSADEGEVAYVKYRKNISSTYSASQLTLWYADAAGEWHRVGVDLGDDAVYGEWHTAVVAGFPAGTYEVAINGAYVDIDEFYGFTLPQTAIMSVEATDDRFGLVNKETQHTFTVRNLGQAQLSGLTAVSDNEHVSAQVAQSTIEAGGETTLTVTLLTTGVGQQQATITVSADEQQDFTFGVTGYVASSDVLYIDFSDGEWPAGWDNTGWTLADGVATGGYTSATTTHNAELTSPQLTVAEGEVLAIEATGDNSSSFSVPEFRLHVSADRGLTWTLHRDLSAQVADGGTVVVLIDDLGAGSYKLRLEGYKVSISRMAGYHVDDTAPELAVYATDPATGTPAALVTGQTYDFGTVTTDATTTYYLKNVGTGTLQATMAVTEGFTVAPATVALAMGESAAVTVTLPVGTADFGPKEGTFTVSGMEIDTFEVALTGVTRDSTLLYVDFDDNQKPEGWVASAAWFFYNGNANHYSASDIGTLTTPRLVVAEGESLVYDAKLDTMGEEHHLKVEYSANQQEWVDATEDVAATLTEDYTTQTVSSIPAGDWYVRFEAQNIYIDDVQAYRLNPVAPVMAVYADDPTASKQVAIVSGRELDYGEILTDSTVVFYVENSGVGALEAQVTTTGAIVAMPATLNVAAGEVVAVTVTLPVGTDDFGGKEATLTVDSPILAPVTVTLKYETVDITTVGVKALQIEGSETPVYNMRGQRVTLPQKGSIYVKNGRKYVQK